MIKSLRAFSISVIFVLLGCGGGGGSQGISSSSALVSLPNGEGVAKVNISDSTKFSLIYAPEISSVVTTFNNPNQNINSGGQDIDPDNFPIIYVSGSTVVRRGAFVYDDGALNVSSIKDSRFSDLWGLYLEVPGDTDILGVTGVQISEVPLTGGAIIGGPLTYNRRNAAAPGSLGSFSMTINYLSGVFSISGSASNVTISGTGIADLRTGLFVSSNLNINVGGTVANGTLYGSLSGPGADRAIGVYYSNDFAPDHTGSFFGGR